MKLLRKLKACSRKTRKSADKMKMNQGQESEEGGKYRGMESNEMEV